MNDEAQTIAPDLIQMLEALDTRLRWLSAWTIHNANHLRESRDGLKVGGHQASCASMTAIMARYDINLPNSQNINRVDSRAYLDLSGSYTPTAQLLGGKMQLYGSISNVFDTEEPAQLRLIGNPLQFDPIGRAFRLGVRANW
ncbi:MAG: hypothetical protein WDN76_07605 [Alphaproteobacteria bacterium]